jgi:hypothetical protein
MRKVLTLLVLLATPLLAFGQDEAARRSAGCGPNEIQFDVKQDKKQHPKGVLEPGKALVYILDNRGGVGVGIPPARVGVDGTWVGANFKASYFYFAVAPGTHNLCTSGKGAFESVTNASLVATTFTAEAGQIYFFAVGYFPETQMQTLEVREIAPAEGELQIGKLPFSTFTQKPNNSPGH